MGEKLMMNGRRITGSILIGIGLVIIILKIARIYDPAGLLQKFSDKTGGVVAQTVKNVGADKLTYIILGGLPILIGALVLAGGEKKSRQAEVVTTSTPTVTTTGPIAVAKSNAVQKAIRTCTVVQVGPQSKQAWQFEAKNGSFVLNREQRVSAEQPLPANFQKDWTALFQGKLNVAWLPPEKVFLRVIQLPHSDYNETLSMVEFQMEKLSPMPVAQVVWTIQVLPHSGGKMQTVVVVIASRDAVEAFLGQLEGQGYLADALELPVLDQLQATQIQSDGVYMYPEALGGPNVGLAAWWYSGVLQNLDTVTLPAAEAAGSLREQVTQMAWAGELEGWLTAPPRLHLVASPEQASTWQPIMKEGFEQDVQIIEPLAPPQLAAATARRVALAPGRLTLLPPEYGTRYHQQFVDRLWMKGLLAVCGLYLIGVAVYLVALGVATYRANSVEAKVAGLSNSYTNTIQLKARLDILTERQALRYAALDCWKSVAERLPESMTLESFGLQNGRRLSLHGNAPGESIQTMLDFDTALRRTTTTNNVPLFDWEKSESISFTHIPNGMRWNLQLELKRAEDR